MKRANYDFSPKMFSQRRPCFLSQVSKVIEHACCKHSVSHNVTPNVYSSMFYYFTTIISVSRYDHNCWSDAKCTANVYIGFQLVPICTNTRTETSLSICVRKPTI